ncbi:MAG: hypothetical protein RIF41_34340 [Polyangiaceae bacterium]
MTLGAIGTIALGTMNGCGGDADTAFGETSGSGASGGSGGSTSSSGGSGGTGGNGGTGAAGGNGGSGGGPSTACAAGEAAASGNGVLLWTTLDDDSAVATPNVGFGPGKHTGTFEPALSADGLRVDADGEWLEFPQTGGTASMPNVDLNTGSLDFCYKPNADHTDDADRMIMRVPTMAGGLRFRKAGGANGNALQFIVVFSNGGPVGFVEWVVPSTDYTMNADEWYRLTATWSFGTTSEVKLYLDGVELAVQAPAIAPPISLPTPDTMRPFVIGTDFDDQMMPRWNIDGVVDELVVYDNPIVP